jgi:alpha-tubulin suppressor-like RCC1 family protein
VEAVAAGAGNSLALRKDSTVWAWGNNPGIDTTFGAIKVPVRVKSLSGVIAISGGLSHALAVKNGGTVWAWGLNNNGQLGNGTWDFFSSVPVQASALTGVTAVAGGGFHSIALKNDSTVWAWGNNADGQLGNGSDTGSNVPVKVSSLTGITAVASGYHHSIALRKDSTVWVWGYNSFGQLGNGTDTSSKVPVQVSGLTGVIAISGGGYFCLALKSDSTVWAWGSNGSGQLGNGSPGGFVKLAFQVPGLSGIGAITAGYAHSLALRNDGTVWVWGDNLYGQLGIGSNSASYVPVQVVGLCQGPTGVDQNEDVSDAFELLQTYPNPFNPTANIEYHLLATSLVRLSVFNILGSEIAVLVNNVQVAGEHRVTFDGSNLPAGVYFYRMQAGKFQETRKIVLLK